MECTNKKKGKDTKLKFFEYIVAVNAVLWIRIQSDWHHFAGGPDPYPVSISAKIKGQLYFTLLYFTCAVCLIHFFLFFG
jgi:hypothetical protein